MKKLLLIIAMILTALLGYSQPTDPDYDRTQYGANWYFPEIVRIDQFRVANKFAVDLSGRLWWYNNTVPAAGELLVGNGTYYAELAIGTAYQLLRTNASGNALEWATPGTTSPFQYSGGTFSLPITANYIPYGTGTSIGSEAALTYDPSNNHFSMLGNWFAIGGTNTENYNFHVQEDARVEGVFTSYSASKTIIANRRANGTMASPTAILNGETIGDYSFGGFKATVWSVSSVAAIAAIATEDYDDSGTGTKLVFQTTPNNTTGVVDQLTLTQDGNVQLEKKVTEYNNITLVQDGLPHAVAEVNLTGQTAAIAATTIYTAPADGKYLLVWTAKVTTAATTSSALGPFQYKFTEADDSQVVTAPPGNTNNINQTSANSITTGYLSGSYTVHADAGTAIQYIMGYTTSGATPMAYNLHILLYKL